MNPIRYIFNMEKIELQKAIKYAKIADPACSRQGRSVWLDDILFVLRLAGLNFPVRSLCKSTEPFSTELLLRRARYLCEALSIIMVSTTHWLDFIIFNHIPSKLSKHVKIPNVDLYATMEIIHMTYNKSWAKNSP